MHTERRRIIIADDEKPARDRLRRLLSELADVEIVAECRSGAETIRAINEHAPLEGIFLDIELSDMDGFQVIAEIGANRMPGIVFVTAYNEHAVNAFEVHALDYIVKPFDKERLHEAVRRLRVPVDADVAARISEAVESMRALASREATPYPDRFLLPVGRARQPVSADDIVWVEAVGNYCRVHTQDRNYLHRIALRDLLALLDPARFARIHRSCIVAIDHVVEVRSRPAGDHAIRLSTGIEVRLSRSYRSAFEALFES